MAAKKSGYRIVDENTNPTNHDPPLQRKAQIREFSRMLIADDHVMGLVMEGKISPDSNTEKFGLELANDVPRLRVAAAQSRFASLVSIWKLGRIIEKKDPIEADLPVTQVMLIASDFQLHGKEAVVESMRILLRNTQVSESALFALGFEKEEIEKIGRMGKDEIDQELERMLRKKNLIE